jgi:hypothetical protein
LERLRAKSSYPLMHGAFQDCAWVGILLSLVLALALMGERNVSDAAWRLALAGLYAVDAPLDRATRDTLADLERR